MPATDLFDKSTPPNLYLGSNFENSMPDGSDTDGSGPDDQTVNASVENLEVSGLPAMGVAYSGDTLRDRRDAIVDYYEEEGGIDREKLRSFVVFSHATIETYSAKLIRKYVIETRFESSVWEYLHNNMSQGHRENLLEKAGIFDGNTTSSELRGLRNTLAHSTHEPIDWEQDNVEDTLEEAIDVIDRLHDALTNEDIIEEVLESDQGL